ncbi:hypothetical protein EMLAB_25710 [Enterococcus mundtii]|nr:hypothetical protein EMLAB_25710 [Enterococcus mundtii]
MEANHLFRNKHNVFLIQFQVLTKEYLNYFNNEKLNLIVNNKFGEYVSGYYNKLSLVLIKTIPNDKDCEKISFMLNLYDGYVIYFAE